MDYLKELRKLSLKMDHENIVRLLYEENGNSFFAKVENHNLTGSIKDRAAIQMMISACQKGQINKETVFIEATSGNMGISIAYIAYLLGLKSLIIMPSSMSQQRRKMIQDYHGELLLVDGGMKECEAKLHELITSDSRYLNLSQFENRNNALAHYFTTGPEILNYPISFDYIVIGIGTGGTISGIGQYIKEKSPDTKIIGVEPLESPLLTRGTAGPHQIQGIGANFIPAILNRNVIDEVIDVPSTKAIENRYYLAKEEKINVGISSGASLEGAKEIAKKVKGKNILMIFPDNGNRYDEIK